MSAWNHRLDRRALIAGFPFSPLLIQSAQAGSRNGRRRFRAIAPTTVDDLVLPPSYRYQVIARWGDPLGNGATFGSAADFTAFLPIDLLDKAPDRTRPHVGFAAPDRSSSDGLLVVSHEAPWPLMMKTLPEQIASVGVAIVRLRQTKGVWKIVPDERARRYDGASPMLLTGSAATIDGGPRAVGTVANCSGGMTAWGTILTCEENFQDYAGSASAYGWPADPYAKRHYGWVVEIDPFDSASVPRKHTALGRMRHENAAIRIGEDGSVVAYMGDDKRGSCVFKFIAERKLSSDRTANLSLLESGRLYGADFASGEWKLLDHASDERLRLKFKSQAEVLCDARAAAIAIGCTPVDRPEDLEIDPRDGSVMIALTNNSDHGNFHGHLVRLRESNADPASRTFEWEIFATGGPRSGFSSPDNLLFDPSGDLWMCTDVSDQQVARGIYSFMGNNSLFLLDRAGVAYRFASGPPGCELTGPCWTPDARTMFLSVQHPGGDPSRVEEITSHWPEGGSALPRSAVVAIAMQ